MARKLRYDIPGADWRVPVETLHDRGIEAVFAPDVPSPFPLVLDLGFGRGELLQELARCSPQTAFLGVEYSFKRVLKLSRRLARGELRNVRLVEATAERVVGECLPDASVARCWINFPDPWPKKRHQRRRLIQVSFLSRLGQKLVPGGSVHVATDDPDYAEWIQEVFEAVPTLENLCAPAPFRRDSPGRPATAYEIEWRELGRPMHFFSYARRSGEAGR